MICFLKHLNFTVLQKLIKLQEFDFETVKIVSIEIQTVLREFVSCDLKLRPKDKDLIYFDLKNVE